jgi:hypothetical protein
MKKYRRRKIDKVQRHEEASYLSLPFLLLPSMVAEYRLSNARNMYRNYLANNLQPNPFKIINGCTNKLIPNNI